MLVSEILDGTEPFPTIATDTTVKDAATLMRSDDVRALPVVEGERLLGIVTDWDIVDAFGADGGQDLATKPVSAIMTNTNLITIASDASAADATAKLQQNRVHHLPVLGDGQKYVGMLCLGLEWNDDAMLTPPVRPVLTARRP